MSSNEADTGMIDGDLAKGALRAAQAAALAAARFVGRRSEAAVNGAAIEAMWRTLNELPIDGTVVVGEGARGRAPRLFTGEKVGTGKGPAVSVVLNALEGAENAAFGTTNASCLIAMAEAGTFMSVPNIYMNKIAVGPGLPAGVVELDDTPADNVMSLAAAKGVNPAGIVVCMLARPRNDGTFYKLINAGARTMAIADGDVSGVIGTAVAESGIDMYMGIGGAREGVLGAAALYAVRGQMQARLLVRNDEEVAMAHAWNITDLDRKYNVTDLVSGRVVFAASGVTNGCVLQGARLYQGGAVTHSIVIDSQDGQARMIHQDHKLGE